MTFRLAQLSVGSNPLYWDSLQDLIGIANEPIEPDASYSIATVRLSNGQKRQRGFASAVWHLTGVLPEQKYILRQIISTPSISVYIETPTNDYDVSGNREWVQAQAIANWPDGEQDIQADKTLDFDITFTHLVEVV